MREQYLQCCKQAEEITARYKQEYPVDAEAFLATTLAIIAGVTALAAAGVSAYSQYQQAQSQKKMAQWNAQVAQNAAVTARQQGEYESAQIARKGLLITGMQRAAAGRSGIAESGSVNDVMYDSSLQNELDQMTATYKGEVTAMRDVNDSIGDQYQAEVAQESEVPAMAGSILGGVGSATGDAASAAYYSANQNNPSF